MTEERKPPVGAVPCKVCFETIDGEYARLMIKLRHEELTKKEFFIAIIKGSVVPILQDIHGNIQSGYSYAGARNFHELAGKVQFIQQTSAGLGESQTHILNRK